MPTRMDPPFVVVRARTGTPGGVADANFSLQELMAMLRHARQVVSDSRSGGPEAPAAHAEILAVFARAAMNHNPEQARAVLASYLIREAIAEDTMLREAQAWAEAEQHGQYRQRARDVEFTPESAYAPQAPPPGGASVGRVPRGRPAQQGYAGGVPVDGRGDGLTMEAIEAARAERRAARSGRRATETAQERREQEEAARAAAAGQVPGAPSEATLYRERKLAEMEAQKAGAQQAEATPAAPAATPPAPSAGE